MVKQIKKKTNDQIEAQVAVLLETRAHRLRTKLYPRPEKFEKEMAASMSQYRFRCYKDAGQKYIERILKAAGLAISETTKDWTPVNAGLEMRTGVYMAAMPIGRDPSTGCEVTISMHGNADGAEYKAALEAQGLTVTVRPGRTPSALAKNGFMTGNILVVVC